MSVFVERTRTAEDHLVSLWEFLEEEWIIAHKLACSCDRHNIFVNFCTGCMKPGGAVTLKMGRNSFKEHIVPADGAVVAAAGAGSAAGATGS